MTTRKQVKVVTTETDGGSGMNRILDQLTELNSKVEESLTIGRENNKELQLLRRELGLDGPHGRLPIVEATLVRYEARFEKNELRLDKLEDGDHEHVGRSKLISALFSFVGGSLGAAALGYLAHLMGLIH